MPRKQYAMQIRFHIDESRWDEMTLDGQIAFQDYQEGEEANRRGLCDMLAPFMQDKDGKWLEYKQAIRTLGRIQQKELLGVVEQFNTAMQDFLVPKEIGNSSTPSTPEEEALPGSGT